MDLTKIENDFSDEEKEKLKVYTQNGCLGLESIAKDEAKINSMFGLYMSGKTYTEISRIIKVKKNIVMYMSAKMRWYEKRMEYLEDIQAKMARKMSETRIESMNFITSLISMHHKFYGDRIDEYLRTNNRDIIDDLDLKQLTQYFKSIDILEKVMNPTNVTRSSGTTVNINTAGGKIEQLDDKTIDITPGDTGNILKALAALKEKQKEEE